MRAKRLSDMAQCVEHGWARVVYYVVIRFIPAGMIRLSESELFRTVQALNFRDSYWKADREFKSHATKALRSCPCTLCGDTFRMGLSTAASLPRPASTAGQRQ